MRVRREALILTPTPTRSVLLFPISDAAASEPGQDLNAILYEMNPLRCYTHYRPTVDNRVGLDSSTCSDPQR